MTPTERLAGLARLSKEFMKPQVWQGDVWEISANHGETHYVSTDVENDPAKLADYVDGTIDVDDDDRQIVELRRNVWLARLSAPGYLDASDLSAFDTQEEAETFLVETYDDGEEAV